MIARLDQIYVTLPAGSAFSGRTAAWLHALDVGELSRIEVTVPLWASASRGVRLAVRRAALLVGDVVTVHGLPTTSVPRTLADIALCAPLEEAVGIADMALHHGLSTRTEMEAWVRARAGRPGTRRLRRVLELADPASESPMETRLRLLLRRARVPEPESQAVLTDRDGNFVARVDFYFPAHRLCIEFDGGIHRDRLVEDDRRQNRLLSAGYRLLRFTSPDVINSPGAVVAQIRAALATA